jgi:hypothetical protein
MKINCQFCGGANGNTEYLNTQDFDSKDGIELWFCCHDCKIHGEPCETFIKLTS